MSEPHAGKGVFAMQVSLDRAELLERHGLVRPRSRGHRGLWLLSALFVMFLGGAAVTAVQGQQGGGQQPVVEHWSVPPNGQTTVLANNQNPGNFVLKNNGPSTVRYRVENGDGEAITEWFELGPEHETPPVGVGEGEHIKIDDATESPAEEGASGTIRKSAV